MPTQKASWKDLRQSKKRHERNVAVKSELKTLEKNFEKTLSLKDKAQAKNAYTALTSKLDKAASNNTIHKNTASRKKSRLMKALSKLT